MGKHMLNCKQATKLMSKEQDTPLSLSESLSLRFHLMMCSGCRNYNKQLESIRKACQRLGGGNNNKGA
jgi:predicted anti-sigma-YlaC factor YlaD